ncbi:MAG: hypothetical protein HOP19_21590 [Acidobacteria bacterium]|nr:hypothetical protein [Acidobacteriota bacterium]
MTEPAEITITGCNRSKTGPMLATNYQLVASFCLTLSSAPSEEWIHAFEQVRRARRQQTGERLIPARIDAHGLVIKCRPEELQPRVSELQDDVAAANREFKVLLQQTERNATLEEKLRQEIEAAIAKLKFNQ